MSENQDKRLKILEAACKEFSNGYSNTKMAQIAKKCGIGKSTIYEYFKSKEELFAAAYEWGINVVLCDASAIMQEDICFKDKFVKFIEYTNRILGYIQNKIAILNDASVPPQLMENNVITFHTRLLNIVEEAVLKAVENGEIKENINTKNIAKVIAFLPFLFVSEEINSESLEDIASILLYGFSK